MPMRLLRVADEQRLMREAFEALLERSAPVERAVDDLPARAKDVR